MFATTLTQAREKEKLSATDLASLSGVSCAHILNLESGRRPLTLTTLRKLDKHLRFSTATLVALVRGPDACDRGAA